MTDGTDPWPRLVELADEGQKHVTLYAAEVVRTMSREHKLTRDEVSVLATLILGTACNLVCRTTMELDFRHGNMCFDTAIALLTLGKQHARGQDRSNQG